MAASRFFIRGLILLGLCFALFGGTVFAGDPGGKCDPGSHLGHAARLVSITGDVKLFDSQGKQLPTGRDAVVPTGGRIETSSGAAAELAVEDGTAGRSSRLRVDGGSVLTITGGLYCSDMRPKADEGRWSVREIGIQLQQGGLEIELAAGVSHSFNLEVQTPNMTARMVRGTQDRMAAAVHLTGIDDRPMVPVAEHPKIRRHLEALTGGRGMNDLSPREREGVMAQAAMAALSMGLIDLESTGALENPQIRGTVEAMARGRKLEDLPENERQMIMQAAGGMAVQMGLINADALEVHGEPDERTLVSVEAGRMRVHNRHRGWKRDEAVVVESGMVAEVRGYDLPTNPEPVDN